MGLDALSVELQVARVETLRAVDREYDDQNLLRSLVIDYAYDENALERLDCLLAEPMSASSRAFIVRVNREGTALHNQAQFDQAVFRFTTVATMLPRHVGVQLNIVQTLVAKIERGQYGCRDSAPNAACPCYNSRPY